MGPMHMNGIELNNFGVVAGRIYRGEQPKEEDFRALAAIGVTTIIDLRYDANRMSRALADTAGLL